MRSRKTFHRHRKAHSTHRLWLYVTFLTAIIFVIFTVAQVNVEAPPSSTLSSNNPLNSEKSDEIEQKKHPDQADSVNKGVRSISYTSQDHRKASSSPTEEERQQAEQMERTYFGTEKRAELALSSSWTLMPQTVHPGDVILVRSQQEDHIDWQGKTYPLKPFGTGFYTYLPVPIGIEPGKYTIGTQTLTIEEKVFETDYLQVTEKQESILQDTEQIQKDQKKIDEARNHSAAEFLFPADSPFMQPMEGRVTTPFGFTRYVNGKYSGSHRAIDWAAPEGTPVRATNDGVVALADYLHLTGYSVYIDHGMDLYSQYIHMSKLLVETGDSVKKGDVIGLVGSTGFSTGPHLHFTFWAHNVPVNPNLFLNTTPFHWLDDKRDETIMDEKRNLEE
ncbi:MAG: M23 family metallopeptidase [Bacillaceae bacterium]|nr:M23 family metallopeptidase [Bacillaceae bacterium]